MLFQTQFWNLKEYYFFMNLPEHRLALKGCGCRDTEVLCSSLTYVQSPPHVLEGEEVQQYTSVYSPPFDEFEVYRVSLPAGASTLLPANQVHSCLPLRRLPFWRQTSV